MGYWCIFSVFTGIILRILYGFVPDGDDNSLIMFSSASIFLMLIFSITRKRAPFGIPTIFRPDTAFSFFFYILFAHPYLSYELGWSDISYNKFISDVFIQHTNRAVISSAVALLFFQIGYYYFDSKIKNTNFALDFGGEIKTAMVAQNIFLIGFFISLLLFFITGAWIQLVSQYTGLATGDATADGIYFLLLFFSMALLSSTMGLVVVGKSWKTKDYVSVFISISWCLVLLVTGDRNSFLLIALVVPIVYSTFYKRIRFYTWVFAAFFGFIVYQAVEVSRSSGQRDISSFIEALVNPADNNSTDALSESSFSLTTVTSRAAFEGNEQGDSIYFGKFKLVGLMGIVPYSRSIFFDASSEKMTSSEHITEIVLGRWATWSLGSNLVSDIVIDLGVFFIPLTMFLIGAIGGYAYSRVAGRLTCSGVTVYIFLTASYFEYPRYTVDFTVRSFVWLILVFLLAKIISFRSNKGTL